MIAENQNLREEEAGVHDLRLPEGDGRAHRAGHGKARQKAESQWDHARRGHRADERVRHGKGEGRVVTEDGELEGDKTVSSPGVEEQRSEVGRDRPVDEPLGAFDVPAHVRIDRGERRLDPQCPREADCKREDEHAERDGAENAASAHARSRRRKGRTSGVERRSGLSFATIGVRPGGGASRTLTRRSGRGTWWHPGAQSSQA